VPSGGTLARHLEPHYRRRMTVSRPHSPFVAHHNAQGSIGVSPTFRKGAFGVWRSGGSVRFA
jgi:hypothetical protein